MLGSHFNRGHPWPILIVASLGLPQLKSEGWCLVPQEMKEVEAEVFSWLWGLVYKGWDLVLCDSMKHNDLKRFCVC